MTTSERRDPLPLSSTRPQPVRRSWLRNRWEELTFVHWAYPPEVVQRLLPAGVRVDTFEGEAYVSLVPFRMTDAAPRFVPVIPWLSTFAETNVRTYVVDSAGNRAIWFFSLEAARLPIVAFARSILGFPYVWCDMSIAVDGDRRRYVTSTRRWPSRPASTTAVEIEIGDPLDAADDLDVFLTARWGTVAQSLFGSGPLLFHPVEHEPWRLHTAALLGYDDTSIVAAGLPTPVGSPIVRWAQPLDARFGRPTRV